MSNQVIIKRTVDVSISDGMITFFDEARNIKVYEAEKCG